MLACPNESPRICPPQKSPLPTRIMPHSKPKAATAAGFSFSLEFWPCLLSHFPCPSLLLALYETRLGNGPLGTVLKYVHQLFSAVLGCRGEQLSLPASQPHLLADMSQKHHGGEETSHVYMLIQQAVRTVPLNLKFKLLEIFHCLDCSAPLDNIIYFIGKMQCYGVSHVQMGS